MTVGFVMLSIAPAKERGVYDALLKLPQITELHPLFGDYDMIAKIEAKGLEEISDVINQKIRLVKGVKGTRTLSELKF